MIDAVVLDVQLPHAEPGGQSLCRDQRREARVEAGARRAVDRQQLAIAPERLRPPLD